MRKTSWSAIKQIIGDTTTQTGRFLALINAEGVISCANATMVKELEIDDPRKASVNFFDLVHPLHIDAFKYTLLETGKNEQPGDVELSVKNGIYHPMKWQVNYLDSLAGPGKTYLCVGYKIADNERMNRFNRLLNDNCQLIIENVNGIIFHDINGELIAANQKAASIFGTTLENLYSLKNIEALWTNQWTVRTETGLPVPFEETPFVKAGKTRKLQTQTLVIRLRNGEDRWILFNSQPLADEGANGYFPVVSNIIDITSEHHLAAKLIDREALIGSFLQETPDLAWVVDEEGNLHFASAAFYRHFGITEKEGLGKKASDIVPSSANRAVFESHLQVFRTGEPVQLSEKIKWADGSHSVSHIHIFPIKKVSGKKLVGGQAINIYDKSNLEKELKDARERLLNFSRATSDAIWEWDMQSGQIFRNEALMEMIGYQLDTAKGLSWWLRRIHPEDRDRLADKIKEATDTMQQSWQDEYRFKFSDGSYKHVQDKGFVVYENGLPVKMIGSLQNISAIKELENELADVRLQRQKEISETIIKVQEKERTRIGHELHDNVNQLLSAARLFFDSVPGSNAEQKQLKSKGIDYLQMAIEEIRKLSKELVTPQLKEESLAENIRTIIDDIQLAGTLKFSFKYDLDEELLTSGKKITLFRIVQEQLKNIIKHSQASLTQIVLQSKEDNVFLVIRDNGSGFNPQQTRQGIGLSNIHERARFYNGTADIQSSPGAGCTLTVTIPVGEH